MNNLFDTSAVIGIVIFALIRISDLIWITIYYSTQLSLSNSYLPI